MSPQVEAITERLENTWLRWWTFTLLTGLVTTVCLSLGILMVFVLVDALVQLSQAALAVMFGIWVLVTIAGIGSLIYRLRKGQRTLAATARRVELEYPELGSHLINLVQLSELEGPEADDFQQAAMAQAATAVADFSFHAAAAKEPRWRRYRLCLQTPRDLVEALAVLGGLLVVVFIFQLLLPRWSSSTARLLRPWTFVPSVGQIQIMNVTPGDTEVLVGSSLEIVAEIGNPHHQTYPATLFIRRPGEPETAQALLANETNEKFVAVLPQVLGPLQYRLQIGDSQTKLFKVEAREKPTVAEVEVTYHYPPYLNRPGETVTQKHADLDAPQFTLAELRIRASTAIAGGHILVEGQQVNGAPGDDGQTLLAHLFLKNTSPYTIHLFNGAGRTDPEPRVNQVRVMPDAPPTVHLIEPGRESTAAAGGKVSVAVRATDDHGLGLLRIEMKGGDDNTADQKVETVASWTAFANVHNSVLNHTLVLEPARFKPGQVVQVRAVARDRRQVDYDNVKYNLHVKLEPQETASAWHQVRVIAPEAKSAADLAQLDTLRAVLWKVLQSQIKARLTATQIVQKKAPAETEPLISQVRTQQVEVQKTTAGLVETIGKTDNEERLTIKRVANKLAFGDMLQAVRQVEALGPVKASAELAKPVASLNATQDRIIDVLQRLLNEVRRETADLLAEMKKRPGGDLPPDVKDKLRELKDKLQEFLKQQKKVIEATENLAKMPVEDFTDKEKQLLKDLAATEDEWARFMAEVHSDLSKLPEQDFANPSLLEELLEVQTELKMAKDALTKKSADIAVPLEQLGAEMAKELTTNIEKWLPDTPDRERWSQEEPLTDEMKEAPMAELPGELEDLVGELMEQEEDLFDEMEDASSSWADSIDKGAGWDAADGPISNMSAKGVTGNRLPNTSEIGGRSGEGRQGKASGEFVGESAVGKGGRKTPSRLTPDPNVKGQVKDRSKDPVGGATGGGKESGQGGQGLEGPVPNRPERQMERLANKQAELRNKAESVDLCFQVHKYHHSDLKKLIAKMGAVESDLRGGRFRNALRQRDTLLEGLGRVKMYLKGEFSIRRDQTPSLPADIQKEILGNMHEPSPPGWDDLNRKYFERLGTAKPASAQTQPSKPEKPQK